jgi:hypothetical protein
MGLLAAPSMRPSAAAKWSWWTLARTGQVASSFAAVLAAYFLYWLIVVPLIEPTLDDKPIARATDEQVEAAHENVNSRQREIAQYFPPGSWELKNPAIFESDRARLLFKSLRPLPDGRVELEPCTLLFFSKGEAANPADVKRPIIMRAMKGAIVQFDEPVVLKSVDLSKRELVGAHLIGPIHIYRNPSRPGARDDLEITTRDIEMLKERIWTPHAVQFRLGDNHGSGREMEIILGSSDSAPKGGFRPDTMRTLQLKRDVKMKLLLAGGPMAPRDPAARPDQPGPPLEITCQGKFEFQMQSYSASFHDRVDVLQPNLLGEADQLNCELLTVVFDPHASKPPGAQASAAARSDADVSSLSVKVIQARGSPVTLRSPRRGIDARCAGIDYAPAPAGAIGSFVAMGPGIMQRNTPADTGGNFVASWSREFRFEPDGPQHVARLRGEGSVRFAQMGTITADEIFAWMTNTSPAPAARPAAAPGQSDAWQLERVLAQVFQEKNSASQGPVVVDAPQLYAKTDRLEAWVDRPPAAIPPPLSPSAPASAPKSATVAPEPKRRSPSAPQNPTQRFDVRGGKVQIKLVPDGDQLAVSAATIENHAHLQELTPRPNERPLVVKGDRLHVTEANSEQTRVAVIGNPGQLESGGMTLSGRTIEMERKTNRLWINGPGQMTMPVEQDMNGQPLAKPQSLLVTWKGSMGFQTQTVVFLQGVLAQSEQQFLTTEKLEVTLSRPIDFGRPPGGAPGRPQDRPQLSQMRSYGPTVLKSRDFDERGVQTSTNMLRTFDLAIDQISGAINARGPGSLTRTARGAAPQLGAADSARPQQPAAQRGSNADGFTYLNVVYQDSITGNLHKRQVTFGNTTKTVYGPVKQWEEKLDPDAPGGLGTQGMVLEARQLTVQEMPAKTRRDRGWFELEALGNVVAEGTGFTARGDRLTYAEEKDQIVLRGDGLTEAEFFQEDVGGGPRRESTANELTYWLGAQRLLVTGFKSFSAPVPNNQPQKKPAAK